MPKLRILPLGREIDYTPGGTLADILAKSGIHLALPCGGRGVCGGCRVRFLDHAPPPTAAESDLLSPRELSEGIRLSCLTRPEGDCTLEIQVPSPLSACVQIPDVTPEGKHGDFKWAVDLGTTTIYAISPDGEIKSLWNPQSLWGSDVISRLNAATDAVTLRTMREITLSALKGCVGEKEAFVCGNPVMTGILEGRDLSSLLKPPYCTPPLGFRRMERFTLLPEIGGFLGSDALSLACIAHITGSGKTTLALDIGTNTEMFLLANGKIWGTSLPAGPAFEGFGISSGMPAVSGAIHLVREDLSFETVEGKPERGICGSGLISAIYALLQRGIIDCSGKMLMDEYPLGRVSLKQKDIRAFQMAKAAVYAGAKALLKIGRAKKIDRILVAGNFGLSIKEEWFTGLRILPEECEGDIEYLGNTSLWGARWASASEGLRKLMEDLKERITVIQLAEEETFKKAYFEGMDLC